MPEEINRVVTDSLTNYFFTTSEIANNNLKNAGVKEDRIYFGGNTMIDTLLKQMPRFIKPMIWDYANLEKVKFIVLTLHRPANVDEENYSKDLVDEIVLNAKVLPMIFPVHPRTAEVINRVGIKASNLHII